MNTLSNLGIDEMDFSIPAVRATLQAVRNRLTHMKQLSCSDCSEQAMDYSQLSLYAERLSGLLAGTDNGRY